MKPRDRPWKWEWGTGKNIAYYPENGITAIDFSKEMLKKACARAKQLQSRVNLLQADVCLSKVLGPLYWAII